MKSLEERRIFKKFTEYNPEKSGEKFKRNQCGTSNIHFNTSAKGRRVASASQWGGLMSGFPFDHFLNLVRFPKNLVLCVKPFPSSVRLISGLS